MILGFESEVLFVLEVYESKNRIIVCFWISGCLVLNVVYCVSVISSFFTCILLLLCSGCFSLLVVWVYLFFQCFICSHFALIFTSSVPLSSLVSPLSCFLSISFYWLALSVSEWVSVTVLSFLCSLPQCLFSHLSGPFGSFLCPCGLLQAV